MPYLTHPPLTTCIIVKWFWKHLSINRTVTNSRSIQASSILKLYIRRPNPNQDEKRNSTIK